MKRILVPTDFSEYAYYAAEVAASIAKKTGARVFLLHAIDMPSYSRNDSFSEVPDTMEGIFLLKRAKQEFEKLINQPFFEGVEVAEVMQWENVYDTITEKAKEFEIDLIVMGSRGSSGAQEFLVGSNTEKIIRTAYCPVLTIKERITDFNPKNVVFASNFYEESIASFRKLKEFAELFNAKIHLVKVITPANFEGTHYTRTLMSDFAANAGLKDAEFHIYNDLMVEKGIHAMADELDADLLLIETHGRTGLAHFFRQSIAEDVANHSSRSVLSQRIEVVKEVRGAIFPI
jgi:nucleotide-binding universal stress UspA family protein